MTPSDEALYERLKDGDLSAFDLLYARYERRLFGFVFRWLGDHAEAEDVFHEAFLEVLRGKRADFARGTFRAWIYQVSRNLCLNRTRSRERGERAALREGSAVIAPPDTGRDEAERALEAAVGKLPLSLSEVWHLRSSGLSYEEMAEVVGAPLGTIKSRLHEAVARLKKEMEPWTVG